MFLEICFFFSIKIVIWIRCIFRMGLVFKDLVWGVRIGDGLDVGMLILVCGEV